MDFTTQYKISNLYMINRLLPYFTRGWKMVSFLFSISNPISDLHTTWLKWAQEKIIEAKIPFQTISVEWYLNYLYSSYFKTIGKTIKVDRFAHYEKYQRIPSVSESDITYLNDCGGQPYIYSLNETAGDDEWLLYPKNTVSANTNNRFNISAPQINNDSLTDTEYISGIRQVVDKFTCIDKYQVFLMDY